MHTKKDSVLKARGTPEELNAFRTACATTGVKASTVIRDLCQAAIPYMVESCKDGRWRPPVLITERQAGQLDVRAEVFQVANGHDNNQVARVRKVKK